MYQKKSVSTSTQTSKLNQSRRVCIAPMMDWTDRHCRFFHRLITHKALLYTEMVNAGAIVHGDVPRHLRFNPEENPLALQLGGSDPILLAKAARIAQNWGYDEINLNCGCPSERVQKGAFGACLMREADLVADCVKAMSDATNVPITVKHRIGLDKDEGETLVQDFIGKVTQAGCSTFVVHARNAWLKGLSPKQNREVPPLRYDVVHRLKQIFPDLNIIVNGGIQTNLEIQQQLQYVDGVMVGRAAYHNPWLMHDWDTYFFDDADALWHSPTPQPTKNDIEQKMVAYMVQQQVEYGTHWQGIARHMLGLRHGDAGARHWRQVWSDHHHKHLHPQDVMVLAHTPPTHTEGNLQ